MNDDEDPLIGIDLHKWKIPPAPDQRAAILERALAPVAARRPRRFAWIVAAVVIVNAALVGGLAVAMWPASTTPSAPQARPAGSADDEVIARAEAEIHRLRTERDRIEAMLEKQVDDERRELERQTRQIEALQKHIAELEKQLHGDDKAKPGPRPNPQPEPGPRPNPRPDPLPEPQPEPPGRFEQEPPVTPPSANCDEVSCVLQNYEGACCLKYKRAPVSTETYDSLTRDMISTAMGAMKSRIKTCGDLTGATGTVKVHVRVSGAGDVTSVDVVSTPDPALGNCVAAVMQKLHFPITRNGGSFSYPFVF